MSHTEINSGKTVLTALRVQKICDPVRLFWFLLRDCCALIYIQ